MRRPQYRGHRVRRTSRRCLHRRMGSVPAVMLLVLLVGCGSNGSGTGDAAKVKGAGEHRLSEKFALLRTPADHMPLKILHVLRREPLPGMRWSEPRRVPVSVPGNYWLVPGTRNVCIVARPTSSPSVAIVCAPIRQALRHGIADTSIEFRPAGRTIVGVAPDGVRSVSIRCPKATAKVRVRRDGLFTLRDARAEGPETFLLHF